MKFAVHYKLSNGEDVAEVFESPNEVTAYTAVQSVFDADPQEPVLLKNQIEPLTGESLFPPEVKAVAMFRAGLAEMAVVAMVTEQPKVS